jgi:hypothetical protein
LVAAIVFGIVVLVKRKQGDSSDDLTSASNSTSLSDHGNSTISANSTASAGHLNSNSTSLGHDSATATHLPVDGSLSETASAANTASFNDGQYHPSAASSVATPGQATLADDATIGAQSGTATKGLDSLASDSAQSGQPLTSAAVPTRSQIYGVPSSSGNNVASAAGKPFSVYLLQIDPLLTSILE